MRPIISIKNTLAQGGFDQLLSHIYCRPAAQLQPFRDRITCVADGFMKEFDRDETQRRRFFPRPDGPRSEGTTPTTSAGKCSPGPWTWMPLPAPLPTGPAQCGSSPRDMA